SRLRASQGSSSLGSSRMSGSVCVMMNQLGFEANEIGTEAVAHAGVRGFQFEAGDQLGLDRDLDQNRMSEDSGDRFAAGLHLHWGYSTGNRQTDRRAIRAERCPGSLRQP